MDSERKDEELICGLTRDEHDALRRGLARLPDTVPPRVVWQRLREQAEAEGLIVRAAARRRTAWLAAGGLAAAAVVAAILLRPVADVAEERFPTVPETTPSNQVALSALQALMVESRRLESDLRALPGEPRLVRAGTALTISEIEDRIAAIDYQLNDPSVQMTVEDQELFWRERVRLMKSLIRLRYAQAQRTAF